MSATDIIRAAEFTAERAWGARSIANLNGTTVRLHWTDQPYNGTLTTAKKCLP